MRYKIISVQPTFIIGRNGLPAKGFSVKFIIVAYDEEHTVETISDDPDVIEAEIESFIEKRDRLAQLGQ